MPTPDHEERELREAILTLRINYERARQDHPDAPQLKDIGQLVTLAEDMYREQYP